MIPYHFIFLCMATSHVKYCNLFTFKLLKQSTNSMLLRLFFPYSYLTSCTYPLLDLTKNHYSTRVY